VVYPGGKDTQPLADRIADRKGLQRATYRSALFRELGIATQRSTARDIVERSGRLPGNLSAQPSTPGIALLLLHLLGSRLEIII
jgi:hypothetical protein